MKLSLTPEEYIGNPMKTPAGRVISVKEYRLTCSVGAEAGKNPVVPCRPSCLDCGWFPPVEDMRIAQVRRRLKK